MNNNNQITKQVIKKTHNKTRHALMTHCTLSHTAECRFEELNQAVKKRVRKSERLWDYEKIKQDGYDGFHMRDMQDKDLDYQLTNPGTYGGGTVGVYDLDSPASHQDMLEFWAYTAWLFECSRGMSGKLNSELAPQPDADMC